MTTTTKATHTPGPWSFELKNHNRNLYGGDGKSLMCDEQYYPWVPEEDADWNLIAAAPEMLEALELAQTYLRNQQPKWAQAEDLPPIMHELSAAIQKARGGQ